MADSATSPEGNPGPPIPKDEQEPKPAERFPTDNQRPAENPPSEGLKHVQENVGQKR